MPPRSEQQRWSRLAAEIRSDLEELEELVDELRSHVKTAKGKTLSDRITAGKLIHDFYGKVEAVLVKIAKDLNGGVPSGEDWHQRLLNQMALPIAGVRPAVLSAKTRAGLDDYLKFRHVFRNVYAHHLDWLPIRRLARGAGRVHRAFLLDLGRFNRFLSKLAEGIE